MNFCTVYKNKNMPFKHTIQRRKDYRPLLIKENENLQHHEKATHRTGSLTMAKPASYQFVNQVSCLICKRNLPMQGLTC